MKEDKNLNRSYQWTIKLASIIFCILYAGWLFVLVEISARGNAKGVFNFLSTNWIAVLLNISIAAAFIGLFYAMSNKVWVGCICALMVFGLVGFVNIFKMKYHDVPFLPWDIFFFEDALRVAPAISSSVMDGTMKLYLTLVGILFGMAILSYIFIDRMNRKNKRIADYLINSVIFALCLVFLIGISSENQYRAKFFREKEVVNYFWNQKENVMTNGQVLAFTINISNIVIAKPSGYSPNTMDALYKEIEKYEVKRKEQPDIVVIMSESFSDPMKIKGLEIEKDPMKKFRQIGEEGLSGDVYVPVLGGKTANTEFEFLTGYNARLLPEGSVPYQQHVTNDIYALPKFFKKRGYYTTAIHNNIPEFWNRKEVYPHMGFDRFLDVSSFKNPTYYGSWMSDKDLTDKVIETLEENKYKKNQFVFAITVQNHAPYDTPEGTEDIDIKGNLSSEDMKLMKKYVKGIQVSDGELYRLYEYLKEREKPTLLCFFGDHLPGGFEMYRTFPYYLKIKESRRRKDMFCTPYLIWSNYKSKPEKKDLGVNALAALMLEYGDADTPAIQGYNLSQYPGKTGEPTYYDLQNMDEKTALYRKNQYLIMYDDLFGQKYYNDLRKTMR